MARRERERERPVAVSIKVLSVRVSSQPIPASWGIIVTIVNVTRNVCIVSDKNCLDEEHSGLITVMFALNQPGSGSNRLFLYL